MSILHTENKARIKRKTFDNLTKSGGDNKPSSSLVVREGRKRTALIHGISPAERIILDTATHFLDKHCGGTKTYICIEAHGADEHQARRLFSKVKSGIVLLQSRYGVPSWYVEVLEGRSGVHSNIICALPLAYAKRLLSYSYGSHLHVRHVDGAAGMGKIRNYLLKEATPQAVYGTGIRREKGRHLLGEGGGDRVRLSTALRRELLDHGLLPANLVRTYASRSIKNHLRPILASVEDSALSTLVPISSHPSHQSRTTNMQASDLAGPHIAEMSRIPGVAVVPLINSRISRSQTSQTNQIGGQHR